MAPLPRRVQEGAAAAAEAGGARGGTEKGDVRGKKKAKGLVWRNEREGAHGRGVVGDAAGGAPLEGGALCCPRGGGLGQIERGALSGLPSCSDQDVQKGDCQCSERDHLK